VLALTGFDKKSIGEVFYASAAARGEAIVDTYVTQNALAIDVVSQDLEDIPNPVAGRTSRGRRA
jgi:hypothetical protein